MAVAVETVTTTAHGMLARDEYDQAVQLYVADAQDVEGIAKPAAGLLARRSGDALAATNPDVADGLALAVAVAAYIAKQLQKWSTARRLRSSNADVLGHQPRVDTDEPDTEPAAL